MLVHPPHQKFSDQVGAVDLGPPSLAVDLLHPRVQGSDEPAPPALPSVELATLRSELAELKALVTGLASKPAPYPGGTIGPREASASVLGPLRALARQLSHIRGSKYRSALLKLDQRLRRLVSYPNDNGQTWARFPADRYGELTGAVGLLQADAQAEIKAHAERVAREAQLPIAG